MTIPESRDMNFNMAPRIMKPMNYWDEAKIQIEALKFKTRSEFSRGCNAAYCAARARGLIEKVCAHMPKRAQNKGENL